MALRAIAIGLSASRAAFGAAMVVAPERIGRAWIGRPGGDEPAAVLARSIGARDVAIGAGGALALLAGSEGARWWLLAQAGADLGDFVGTMLARERLPASGVRSTAALAGGSGLLASLAAARC